MAAAKGNISDAWVDMGTAVGIFGSQLNMPWLDPLTAIIVGLLICKTAWEIFKQASHELSDGFDENKINQYRDAMIKINGVKRIKEIKGRNYGHNEVLDVVILINSTLTINEAHDIATSIEKVMLKDRTIRIFD